MEVDRPGTGCVPCDWRCDCFKHILGYTATLSLSCLLTESLKTYTISQITALEKQFHLSSTRSGFLISCSEIGFLSCVLFFSHFGRGRHIPRLLAFALMLCGLAGVSAGLLNFISPTKLPDIDDQTVNSSSPIRGLCVIDDYVDSESCADVQSGGEKEEGGTWQFVLLCVSLVLLGAGQSPRMSLGISYLDDNARDKPQASLLVGIVMTVLFFGGAIALGLGGVFSNIPVDLSESRLDHLHPGWIGAWWAGYLLFGILSLLLALPMAFFPKRIKSSQSLGAQTTTAGSLKDEAKDLPSSVVRVLKNPAVTLLLVGNCCIIMCVGGSIPFSPKYIETQFRVPPHKVNFIVATEEFLWAAGGTLCGGVLTWKLKLSNRACVKLVTTVSCVATLIYTLSLVFGCANTHIVGFSSYRNTTASTMRCQCVATKFEPVCGGDGKTYLSPCVAGCTSVNSQTYSNCSEIPGGRATAGQCQQECPYLVPYIAIDLLSGLAGTISLVPVVMTIVNLVEPRDKSMALALTSFLNGLLGFLPAPLVYGRVIDSTCTLWETSACGQIGACSVYDLTALRRRIKGMDVGFQTLTCIAYMSAFLMFKCGFVTGKSTIDSARTSSHQLVYGAHYLISEDVC